MSNVNRAVGLLPVGHLSGGTPQRMSEYTIAGGYGTDIFYGDPVKATGTGKNIALAAAGDRLTGVFAGCQYIDTSGAIQYRAFWPASTQVQSGTQVKAFVIDDPSTVFEIQASGDLAEGDIRAAANILAGDGNAATGNSGVQLDSDSVSTGTGKQLKILGLAERADNDYGVNANVRVVISLHELAGPATAV
ncbi:hypothetical protein [Salinisphaera hydrothermalis]|uniref:Uncharacterized protein n=1 Tax=Salinisphaera hydrothermalis (strain C41B8) TaxID=1304275 RepID=A0A084INN0_SALHC|nr:hypothetical protein [Salinisphaera hydrothermalis]KEZ78314.1 hypothetical protein C41B8_05413 [Salinisphaera hydrothermalis C41B8]